jgi:hypothetical protein
MPPIKLSNEQKAALKVMRDRLGVGSPEQRVRHKQLMAARKAIRAALDTEPATVPQLASQIDLPTAETLWHVTAMKKYGEIEELGQDGDYPRYALSRREDSTGKESG